MKYKEKLEAFIEDLSNDIPYIGVQCCGSCAKRAHIEEGNEVSFWISADDWHNKASQGVDINFISDEHVSKIMEYQQFVLYHAVSNDLSFYSSYNNGYVKSGVYSKKGKQEVKFYIDGQDITSELLNQDLAVSE